MIEAKCNLKIGMKVEDLMCPMCNDYQYIIWYVGQRIEGRKIVNGEKNSKISSENMTELKRRRKQYKRIMEYVKGHK